MPVFVPPAIFDEVQAVFHLPVAANIHMKRGGRNRIGVDTGYEVPTVVEQESAVGRTYFTVGTDGDLAARKVQTLTDIGCVVQVDPKPASFPLVPLFSVISWAGRAGEAPAKQVCSASRTSG